MNFIRFIIKIIAIIIIVPILASKLFNIYASGKRNGKIPAVSFIRSDEELSFFPGYAFKVNENTWEIYIHAWVYEHESNSKKRKFLINIIKKKFKLTNKDLNGKIFTERIKKFLVDQEKHKSVSIQIGNKSFSLGMTKANGHAQKIFNVSEEFIIRHRSKKNYIHFTTVSKYNNDRIFKGKIEVIPENGISVISDIDDTIKISEVLDKKKLLENTFLKPFVPVPQMAKVYSKLASQNVNFHYLTASPWQLYVPLSKFLSKEKFPYGIYHMKYFGLGNNFLNLFKSSKTLKIPAIINLLKTFPKRKFILIGDSGEHDPEIFGTVAKMYKNQIIGVFIRNIRNESKNSERYKNAFRDFYENRWFLFKDGNDLNKHIKKLSIYTIN